MAASDDSFSLRALSSEWIFPRSEAMTTPLPLATADEPAPGAAELLDFFLWLLLVLLLTSDRVASLDYGRTDTYYHTKGSR